MSYSFDGTNDQLVGTIATAISDSVGVTIFCWSKITTNPAARDCMVQVGADPADGANDFVQIGTSTVQYGYECRADGAGGAGGATVVEASSTDGVWVPLVGSHTSAGRAIWSLAEEGSSGVANDVPDLDNISIGTNLSAGQDYTGLIAEVAVWDVVLSDVDKASLRSGLSPSVVDPTHLRLYYPLDTDHGAGPIANDGLDADGELTIVNNAVYNADHPSITLGGTSIAAIQNYYRMLRCSNG